MSATKLAASYFDPLAERHGLKRKSLSASCVAYRRGAVFLEVWFDYRGAEFSVVIGRDRLFGAGLRFYLSDILERRRVDPGIGSAAFDETNQRTVLQNLARLTGENAGDLLSGDASAFASAALDQQQRREASSLAWELKGARQRADRAWRAKDYAGVIAALEPIEDHLSVAERARLQYCRKHR